MTESETRVSNAVMADIAKSRFGRYLRMAILIHVVVLAVSSVPYIRYRLAERRAAAAAVAAGAEAPADAAEAAAAAPPAPAPVPAPETRQPDRADPRTNDAAPAAPAAASALEALPAPGEKPAATELDLGL